MIARLALLIGGLACSTACWSAPFACYRTGQYGFLANGNYYDSCEVLPNATPFITEDCSSRSPDGKTVQFQKMAACPAGSGGACLHSSISGEAAKRPNMAKLFPPIKVYVYTKGDQAALASVKAQCKPDNPVAPGTWVPE